jgi:hypothetical protein
MLKKMYKKLKINQDLLKKKRGIKIIKFKGGLGNQLFQYGLYDFFEKKNFLVYADLSFYINQKKFKKISTRKFYLHEIFKKKLKILNEDVKSYEYLYVQKFENLFVKLLKLNIITPNIYWEGYWQNIFFAKNIKKKLFKNNILKISKKFPKDYYILHFRCGDFRHSKDHIVIDADYYKKALKKFSKYPVIALSDDNIQLKRLIKKIDHKEKIIEATELDTLKAFSLIVNSQGGIASNSTFAWWGSFLCKSSNWLYPEKWLRNVNTVNTNLKIANNKIII